MLMPTTLNFSHGGREELLAPGGLPKTRAEGDVLSL